MPVGPFGLVVAKAPPWSRKQYILKNPPPWYRNRAALSGPQIKACLALGTAAISARGSTGKAPYKGVSMPIVAVKVAGAVPKGAGVHGGRTAADRRALASSSADASMASLRSLLALKGA
jgi:hypothetical protein